MTLGPLAKGLVMSWTHRTLLCSISFFRRRRLQLRCGDAARVNIKGRRRLFLRRHLEAVQVAFEVSDEY